MEPVETRERALIVVATNPTGQKQKYRSMCQWMHGTDTESVNLRQMSG